jgi:enoyl-CoA hydratase/carnithine racemase
MSEVHLLMDGPVAEMRLDNPAKLNALTPGMLDQIMAHCDALERETQVVAVLVTATGPKAFCTGADINALALRTSRGIGSGRATGCLTGWRGCPSRPSRCWTGRLMAAGWNWPRPAT